LLFVNRDSKQLERYEPNGWDIWREPGSKFEWVNEAIRTLVLPLLGPDYVYLPPLVCCPQLGPQQLQAPNIRAPRRSWGRRFPAEDEEEEEYCVVYCAMAAHLRILFSKQQGKNKDPNWLEWQMDWCDRLMPQEHLELVQKYLSWMDSVVPELDHVDRVQSAALKEFDKTIFR
jgi:hypothetical protein